MKKRLLFLLAASVLIIGCGKTAENQSNGASSVDSAVESTVDSTSKDAEENSSDTKDKENTSDAEDKENSSDAKAKENSSDAKDKENASDAKDKGTEENTSELTGGSEGLKGSDDEAKSAEGNENSSDTEGVQGQAGAAEQGSAANQDQTNAQGQADNQVNAQGQADNQNPASGQDQAGAQNQANDQQQAGADSAAQQDESAQSGAGYGRIFFIGDSRTVDMFSGDAEEIYDYDAGGIRVFAKDGCHCAYMQDIIGNYSDQFDTIVSWLGCNDNNDAALYSQVYESLINQGKTVVICTVGPTADESLSGDFDVFNYPNEKMVAFNQSITAWAASHGVKVIDTYSYVSSNIEISGDGIHYNPKPTTAIWSYIVGSLQ